MVAQTPAVTQTSVVAQTDTGLHEPFKHQLLTKHFAFYSVTESGLSKYYGEYLEDFLLCLSSNFVTIPSDFHLSFYLYPSLSVLNMEGCTRPPRREIEGRYVQPRNIVFTYEDCGIGTMSHELMHKIVHDNFKNPEPWAKEGIPTFFESAYGYKSASGPVLYAGYQSPWRTAELGKGLVQLTLKEIVAPEDSLNPYQESDKQLLSTFLFHEGKLPEYFKLAKTDNRKGFKTLVEASFGKQLSEIEPAFRQFVQSISANKTILLHLPKSQYFQSQAEFDSFYLAHRNAFEAKPNLTLAKAKLLTSSIKTR